MHIFTTVRRKLAAWYRGTYVPPPENDPNSSVVFIGTGFYIQSRSAKILGLIGRFYLRHWQWFWSTAIAAIALYVSILALK